MKPKNDNPTSVTSDYAKTGKKMVIQSKPGEAPRKNLTVGTTSKIVNNGIYIPKPTQTAKAPVAAPKKTNFKAPSSRQTGMKMAMKQGGKGPKCK